MFEIFFSYASDFNKLEKLDFLAKMKVENSHTVFSGPKYLEKSY